ncbi:hypothetical protein BJV74DRAFT_82088 [Russula compacta]|nr:hypothetical protein BJV74DRAFT_82088 [Russula compacta]
MSKQSQPQVSSPGKSMRSRMGTIMRRSSTALTGGFRPGTPSKSSTESLRLDAAAPGPVHVMPSPVAESPGREAAESMPEPTGPSKLSGAPITVPRLEPPATISSSMPEQPREVSSKGSSTPLVEPTPEPASSELAPPESSSTALPGKPLEPIPIKSVDPTSYVSHSPESLSRAAPEYAMDRDEAPPVRQSEDSSTTQSHGQVLPPHERQLPTEILAAPWDSGPLVAERSSQPEHEEIAAPKAMSVRPNPVFTDRVPTPPIAVEAAPVKVDNISADKSSVASLMLKVERGLPPCLLRNDHARHLSPSAKCPGG